ncbi:MAG: hypothetical protein GX891_03595 [Clostridiales bacterium]|nr:hypothetical protein [Clostridiales bacterium]
MAVEKQNVLSKKEKAVMRYIFTEATKSKGVCLLRPIDIMQNLPYELDYEENEVESILKALELDDYFDITETDKKGEFFYCITLQKRGLAFARDEATFKRKLRSKIAIGLLSGLLTALAGWLLKYILSSIAY